MNSTQRRMVKPAAISLVFAAILVGLVVVFGRAASAREQMPRDRRSPAPAAAADQHAERAAAIERAAALQPGNAAAQHALGTLYFERTKDPALTAAQKQDLVERGLAAEDRALAVEPDYVEALIYKNLLLRVQSTLETDPLRQQALVQEADALRARALRVRQARGAGLVPEGTVLTPGALPPPPPPPPGASEIQWVYATTQLTTEDGAPIETVKHVRPVYAPMVMASGIQGDVVLDVTVDSRGKVAQVRVVRSLPFLTQAAIDAVRQWEFAAVAVPREVTVRATFTPPHAAR